MAQRRPSVTTPRKTVSSAGAAGPVKAEAARRPADQPQKLSYKQQFALETLPGRIADAEAEIARMEETMAAPDFYTSDPSGFNAMAGRLQERRDALATMEDEWLELEVLREELEG
ncbi:MAG: ABC transporter C-terminal domain-containing protein [Pararhizobium sp.]